VLRLGGTLGYRRNVQDKHGGEKRREKKRGAKCIFTDTVGKDTEFVQSLDGVLLIGVY